MLINGGELDGVRILSPATVARMITPVPSEAIRITARAVGSSPGIRNAALSNAPTAWSAGVSVTRWSRNWRYGIRHGNYPLNHGGGKAISDIDLAVFSPLAASFPE